MDDFSSPPPEDNTQLQAANDPYHGIILAKDRKEVIIDTVPPAKQYKLSGRMAAGAQLKRMACTEITSVQWMSGVPLGSEQSVSPVVRVVSVTQWRFSLTDDAASHQYFLEAYQRLVMQPVSCPNCANKVPRTEGQFMAKWPTLFAFLDHLDRILSHRCSSCSTDFCLACGDKPHAPARRVTRGKAAEAQKAEGTGVARQSLMHCPLVTSLILGLGLMQIETVMQTQHDTPPASPIADKHKTVPAATTSSGMTVNSDSLPSSYDGSDDEYAPYAYMEDEECGCANCLKMATAAKKCEKGAPSGIGFAGSSRDDYHWQAKQLRKQKAADELVRQNLELLRPYVPDPSRFRIVDAKGDIVACDPVEHDHLPDIVTIAHLRRRFLPLASELLQSGSIADVTDREPLFTELLMWFRLFSRHANLAALVAQPIMGLTKTEWRQSNSGGQERVQTFVATASPRELAQSIVDQTQVLLRGIKTQDEGPSAPSKTSTSTKPSKPKRSGSIKSNKSASPAAVPSAGSESQEAQSAGAATVTAADADQDKVLAFCRSLIDNIGALDAALVGIKGQAYVTALLASFGVKGQSVNVYAGDSQSQQPERAVSHHQQVATYQEWAKGAVFDEADMVVTTDSGASSTTKKYCHVFDKDIQGSAKLQNSHRNLIIAKEIALFHSSLPADWDQAIFVRVDTARIDVMKALIVGPPCSPYKNGLFAFDIFLPELYKTVPPKVKITNTYGGTVRFGPNLYSNGKVCLSLLGTWSGPGWRSDSTVLQVLLSITSMVMGLEEPCINEPGWERHKGTESSLKYSKNLRRQTVRVAMKQMLEQPPHPWEEVIKQHFKLKVSGVRDIGEREKASTTDSDAHLSTAQKFAIAKQLDQWLQEDDGLR